MSAPPVLVTLVASPQHAFAGHPESPSRFSGLSAVLDSQSASHWTVVEPRNPRDEELLRVHSRQYLDDLFRECAHGPAVIDPAPTYVAPGSYEAARLAAGASIRVVEEILGGRADRGMAFVRPPGHHALPDRAMGFCLINNIAVAARAAQEAGAARIWIYDFDVHHGNGTQHIFGPDADVYYASTHQAGIYPGTGYWQETGEGPGRGTVLNIPLPADVGLTGFGLIMDTLLVPSATRFRPDLLLISAGFDAHWRDPLAGLSLTVPAYFWMARRLRVLAEELCHGRIVFLTEGGYIPDVVSTGAQAILSALTDGGAPADPFGAPTHWEPDIRPLVDRIRAHHGL